MGKPTGRVRVAISIPKADTTITNNGQFPCHVGHARTIYLGKLFADLKGLPFHIRLDGHRKLFGDDLSLFVVDILDCLRFFGITPDALYWRPERDEISRRELQQLFGEWDSVLQAFSVTTFSLNAVVDDLRFDPSWIVRGLEFAEPDKYNGTALQRSLMSAYVEFERGLYQCAGKKMHQWNVPLITMGGMKLSKSEGRIIPWGVLKLLDRGAVHRFCLSTAICPDDPLSVREEALDISGIGDAPYEWSWETYKEFLS